MKTRIAAAIAAPMLGVAAPTASALASPYDTPRGHYTGFASEVAGTTGAIGVYGGRDPATCPMSSAAESNANQRNFPVKQYGQTAGGNRCQGRRRMEKTMKAFSYDMIGAFAAGLGLSLWGSAGSLAGL